MAVDWHSVVASVLRSAVRTEGHDTQPHDPQPHDDQPHDTARRAPGRRRASRARQAPEMRTAYPGDFTGVAQLAYEPRADGRPDPGEVVWTWVPYEEDHARGKDRPVLVVARDGAWLLGLMLTSRDHEGPGSDEQDEALHGRTWLELGAGPWDRGGRPSQVRTDRVVRVDPTAVRREGAQLDGARFDRVADALRAQHGWE